MVEKRKLFLYFLFFFKNCTSLGPNWSILLGSWKGQIEKKFQSRIHRGQFRFWRGRNGTCPARFGSNSPKRTLMGQTGPREIGANLAFGVNLALFILQCTSQFIACLNEVSLRRLKREWEQSIVKRQLSDNNSNSKQGLKSDAKRTPYKMRVS